MWFCMEYYEKQIRSEEKYKGIIVRVRLDEAELTPANTSGVKLWSIPAAYPSSPSTTRAIVIWSASFVIPSVR